MTGKRITIFSGHYGSGKTNIAVNYATDIAKSGKKTTIADLDIVNPYFRTKDSEQELNSAGVNLICSEYANSNVDIPALPQEMYCITDDTKTTFVLDVGGDERGALALGRLTPKIAEENSYEMLFVANFFRPLTKTADQALQVMREIENACGLKFSAIVNNSNLGAITTKEDILKSSAKAEDLSKLSNLPIRFTCADEMLKSVFGDEDYNIYFLKLQKRM